MPWKESSVMEERLRFVARLLEGEAMTNVCQDLLRSLDNKAGFERLRPKPNEISIMIPSAIFRDS
jgi:hypothetical protein